MPKKRREWTKEECLTALRNLSEALGGARPTAADLIGMVGRAAGCPPKGTIERLFGSFSVAVEAAGLSNLPTAGKKHRAESFSRAREQLEEFLKDKKVLFRSEKQAIVAQLGKCGVNQRAREDLVRMECRKRGIRVLKVPNDPALCAVISWLAGQPYLGILPDKELVEVTLGDEATRLLRATLEAGSFAAGARMAGYSLYNALKVAKNASRKAVEELVGKIWSQFSNAG